LSAPPYSPFRDRLYKEKTPNDSINANLMLWKAGLSFQTGIWLLWVPSVVTWYIYRPPSIHIADVLNPVLLYWAFTASVFTRWVGTGCSLEGIRSRLKTQKEIFSLRFVPLHDPSSKMKLDNCCDFLAALSTRPGFQKIHETTSFIFMGRRFVEWQKLHNNRRGSLTLDLKQEEIDAINYSNPYKRRADKRMQLVMVAPAVMPFIVRAIDGRSVFGESASAIIINVLLTPLTVWDWFSLFQVMGWRVNDGARKLTDFSNLFLLLTTGQRRADAQGKGTMRMNTAVEVSGPLAYVVPLRRLPHPKAAH